MKISLIALLILSTTANAKIRISKNLFGSYSLYSNDCQELETEVNSIVDWYKHSEGKECSRPRVYRDKFNKNSHNTNCRVTITKCLPEHVKKYNGTSPKTDGPNCWNLSLVMTGILPQLRYSTPEEMDFYMNPPLCRALQNGEDRKPGDIGAIRYGNGEEIHGFIRVTDNISYSKNGYVKQSPYELQSQKNVYDAYGINNMPKNCLDNRIDENCYSGVEFYRCISMKEYLKNTSDQDDGQLEKAVKNLDKLDCATGQISFTGAEAVLDDNTIDTIQTLTDALTRSLSEELSHKNVDELSEKEAFILGATKLRLNAIDAQLSIYQYNDKFRKSFKELLTLRQLVRESKRELEELNN